MTEREIRELLDRCVYGDWKFHLGVNGERLFMQVKFSGRCSYSGIAEPQSGRKWILSPFMTKSEIVNTAFMAVLAAEEHEAREHFKYRGKAIFGPHFDVDKLCTLCEQGAAAIDVRE